MGGPYRRSEASASHGQDSKLTRVELMDLVEALGPNHRLAERFSPGGSAQAVTDAYAELGAKFSIIEAARRELADKATRGADRRRIRNILESN
jgi:hypothetical protein